MTSREILNALIMHMELNGPLEELYISKTVSACNFQMCNTKFEVGVWTLAPETCIHNIVVYLIDDIHDYYSKYDSLKLYKETVKNTISNLSIERHAHCISTIIKKYIMINTIEM